MPSGDTWPFAFPASVPERKELYTRLVGWAKAAKKKLESNYELRLGKRFSGDRSHALVKHLEDAAPATRNPNVELCLPRCTHVVDLEDRPNPFLDTASEDNVVKIMDPLHIGTDSNSQVYTGMLADVKVVVKIYQSSWMLEEQAFEFLNKDEVNKDEEKESSIWDFVTEQWAYERMRPIQGMAVPHVYGFFEVELPHGEPCIAMVVEYIEPLKAIKPLKPPGKSKKKDPRRKTAAELEVIGTRLFLALHAVHSCDIYLQDTSHHNVVVPKEHPNDHVFIDFGRCATLKSKKPHYGIRKICDLLYQFEFKKPSVRAWIRSRLEGDDARNVQRRAMFDLPDDSKKLDRTLTRLLDFKDGDDTESSADKKEEEEEEEEDGMDDDDDDEEEEDGMDDDEEEEEDGMDDDDEMDDD